MNYPLTGYHHITACAGGAQEDVDFFTQVVGLRMAKQTVLMDGSIPIYHLYYSNAKLEPGSVMTIRSPTAASQGGLASGPSLGDGFQYFQKGPCRFGKIISNDTISIKTRLRSGSGNRSFDSGIHRDWPLK